MRRREGRRGVDPPGPITSSSWLMPLGVRREAVLSRWEIQVTRLRAESPHPPATEQEALSVASLGRVVERPLGRLVFCQVLWESSSGLGSVWQDGESR